ncbi:uncharacterized protein LOC113637916 isoform X4 [Tachysurus fulvidraco]|uniref:uncharacterized protein LOC113637916 isoform X3 n=1 Tax=Tachysurus fulvidraco TaxID=1234273 RepID=UPI001FF00419|nr:uncharacterized protein LOC113637916 isoform X3 [Tachysurus fulvidraco]XP_047676661.1 uncharacterized protein LOC113637916 isoform X4 [Tachysurus fulvidraco]
MAGSVCFGALGFVLLFLLSTAGAEVTNLRNIIDHLKNTYGVNGQYALGINVLDTYCTSDGQLDQNFLSQDEARHVHDGMNSEEHIYNGVDLVGARPRPFGDQGFNIHSEFLLLRETNPSPMQNLLNKRKNGCTVFFTLNSPCVNTCSTPTGPHSIIEALDMFNSHNGPKAFVFNQIWHHDEGKTKWSDNILQIEKRIPVYRCNNSGCVRCVTNDVVNTWCVGQK